MTISVKSRKAKGRRLQQWIAKQISELTGIPWGKEELIRSREGGQSGTDVVLLGKARDMFPNAIEAKSVKKLAINLAIEQSKTNMKKEGYHDWLVFLKKDYEAPVVVMDAERFFKMCREMIENKNTKTKGIH